MDILLGSDVNYALRNVLVTEKIDTRNVGSGLTYPGPLISWMWSVNVYDR